MIFPMKMDRTVLRLQIKQGFTHEQIYQLDRFITGRIGIIHEDGNKEYTTIDMGVRDLFYMVALNYTKVPWEEKLEDEVSGYQDAAFGPKEDLPRIAADPGYCLAVRAIAEWRLSECAGS